MTRVGERLHVDTTDPATLARHVTRYRTAIRLANRTGGRWLDAACGTGYGTSLVADVADEAWGVDKDERAIGYAKLHETGRFLCMDLLDLRAVFRADLDVVLCVETLEHLTQPSQRALVDVFAEVMHPGGTLVVACPIGDGGPNPRNPWHLHEPTKPELYDLLYGRFRVVSITTEGYVGTSGPATQAYAVARCPTPQK